LRVRRRARHFRNGNVRVSAWIGLNPKPIAGSGGKSETAWAPAARREDPYLAICLYSERRSVMAKSALRQRTVFSPLWCESKSEASAVYWRTASQLAPRMRPFCATLKYVEAIFKTNLERTGVPNTNTLWISTSSTNSNYSTYSNQERINHHFALHSVCVNGLDPARHTCQRNG